MGPSSRRSGGNSDLLPPQLYTPAGKLEHSFFPVAHASALCTRFFVLDFIPREPPENFLTLPCIHRLLLVGTQVAPLVGVPRVGGPRPLLSHTHGAQITPVRFPLPADWLSPDISHSRRPNSIRGTWFQNLQGCLGNEESQGEGESHVRSSDPVPDHVQQVQHLTARKEGGTKFKTSQNSKDRPCLVQPKSQLCRVASPSRDRPRHCCPCHLRAWL